MHLSMNYQFAEMILEAIMDNEHRDKTKPHEEEQPFEPKSDQLDNNSNNLCKYKLLIL